MWWYSTVIQGYLGCISFVFMDEFAIYWNLLLHSRFRSEVNLIFHDKWFDCFVDMHERSCLKFGQSYILDVHQNHIDLFYTVSVFGVNNDSYATWWVQVLDYTVHIPTNPSHDLHAGQFHWIHCSHVFSSEALAMKEAVEDAFSWYCNTKCLCWSWLTMNSHAGCPNSWYVLFVWLVTLCIYWSIACLQTAPNTNTMLEEHHLQRGLFWSISPYVVRRVSTWTDAQHSLIRSGIIAIFFIT